MAEFCLKWNNHIPNTLTVLQNLMTAETFTDVTLACDGHTIKAHRVILAACSTFFHQMFLANPSTHPIVVLHGMTYTTVKAIVDFMYKGEVSVKSSELAEMLHMARTLDVKGLTAVCKEQLCIEENEAARAAAQQQQQERLRKLQEQHKKKVTARKSVVVEREDDEDMVMDEDENEAPLQDIESNFEEEDDDDPNEKKKRLLKFYRPHAKIPQRDTRTQRRSVIWKFFSAHSSDIALCHLCGKNFSFRSSISNLKKHLRYKHTNIDIEAEERKKSMAEYVPKFVKQVESEKTSEFEETEVTSATENEKTNETHEEVTIALLNLQQTDDGTTYVTIPQDTSTTNSYATISTTDLHSVFQQSDAT